MKNYLNEIYDDTRRILLQSENVAVSINRIKHKKLRDILTELLKTCQADLLIFLDLVYQVEACESDNDISEIVDNFSEVKEIAS